MRITAVKREGEEMEKKAKLTKFENEELKEIQRRENGLSIVIEMTARQGAVISETKDRFFYQVKNRLGLKDEAIIKMNSKTGVVTWDEPEAR